MTDSTANDEWQPLAPEATEGLGRGLAVAADALGVEKVLTWNQSEYAVLGHVVARELGVSIVYANEVEGILDTFGTLRGSRVLIVFAEKPKESEITALTGLVDSSAAAVVGVFGPDGAVTK